MALRRNVADLAANDMNEFIRFAVAFQKLKTSYPNELYAINAIHGGGFNDSYKVIMQNFASKYAPGKDWRSLGYCTHFTPSFLIWHRVYVRCMEILLQKCDPQNGSPNLLALHYWAWDQEVGEPLPDWATNSHFFDDASGKPNPNPFISGTAYGFSGQTSRAGTFLGVTAQDAATVTHALAATTYMKICMTNTGHDFEGPHNALHIAVGGATHDMAFTAHASWDPIFWLHHSNVERMHYTWLAHHPEVLTDDTVFGGDSTAFKASLLYPFPSKAKFDTDGQLALPWNRPLVPAISTAGEWLDNSELGYSYYDGDGMSAIGTRSSPRGLFSMAVPGSNRQAAVKKVFQIRRLSLRGSGGVETKLKIGKTTIALDTRHMFSFEPEIYCPSCERVEQTLGWDLHLTPAQVAAAAKAKVVSFKFKGVDIPAGFEPGWFDEATERFTPLAASDTAAPPAKKPRTK